MDLRQLRYFVEIVESGSFSKAASRLHVAQPALSQHVRRMEEELGVALQHRGTQGVMPTEAGERLGRHARRLLDEFAEIPESVRDAAATPRGEVRFGMPGTVAERLAVPLIEAARARYPGIRIRVVEAMSGYVPDWLRRGDVDLAMIYGAADPRGLTVHHALSEEICLFAGASIRDARRSGRAVSLKHAARLPLIVPGPGHGLRDLIDDAARAARATVSPAIEIDSYSQIKKLAMRGLGFGMLPLTAVEAEAEKGVFRTWRLTPRVTRKVYLAYATERPLLNAPRAIGQLSWQVLRRLVLEKTWAARLPGDDEAPDLWK